MSRQKECEQLADVINKYYIGKVVEIQNVLCIPPNFDFIKSVSNDIADLVLQADECQRQIRVIKNCIINK